MRNSPTQIERIGPWPVPSPPPVVIPTGETWGKDERDKVWIEVGLHVKSFLKHGPMGTGPEIPQSTTMLNSKKEGKGGREEEIWSVWLRWVGFDLIQFFIFCLIYLPPELSNSCPLPTIEGFCGCVITIRGAPSFSFQNKRYIFRYEVEQGPLLSSPSFHPLHHFLF